MNKQTKEAFDSAETFTPDEPQPLIRKVDPAAAFPVAALGQLLAGAARAIHDNTQAPLAMCAQAVLAASTLAAQPYADVQVPYRGGGSCKPLSNFFLTVGESGERKSSVDKTALRPLAEREKQLCEEHAELQKSYLIKAAAYEAAEKNAKQGEKGKDSYAAIEANLRAVGDRPQPPLAPMLLCSDPTIEGFLKQLGIGQPSMGVFSAEGGTFIGGYGMSKDNKIKTASALSLIWDGAALDRVRALDGSSKLFGRRASMHLMAQPIVASEFLGDAGLNGQGLLARVLLCAPETTAGTRFEMGKVEKPESRMALQRYEKTLLDLLQRPLPLAVNKKGEVIPNELQPPALQFDPEAKSTWIQFHDHIERQQRPGGELDQIRGLASKMPEHAARIAGVLALIDNPDGRTITDAHITSACELCGYYLSEALRLFGCASVNVDLANADRLRLWLLSEKWPHLHISYADLTNIGPNWVRDGVQASSLLKVLEQYRWLIPNQAPVIIKGRKRREAWQIAGKVVKS